MKGHIAKFKQFEAKGNQKLSVGNGHLPPSRTY